jgi:hypothetical protein
MLAIFTDIEDDSLLAQVREAVPERTSRETVGYRRWPAVTIEVGRVMSWRVKAWIRRRRKKTMT